MSHTVAPSPPPGPSPASRTMSTAQQQDTFTTPPASPTGAQADLPASTSARPAVPTRTPPPEPAVPPKDKAPVATTDPVPVAPATHVQDPSPSSSPTLSRPPPLPRNTRGLAGLMPETLDAGLGMAARAGAVPPPPLPIPVPPAHFYDPLRRLVRESEVHPPRTHRWAMYDEEDEEDDPLEDRNHEKDVRGRLRPTLRQARIERDKAARRAQLTGWALTGAIGAQVVVGALTTALGAALSGHKTSVAISILGGASTVVATGLARMRGSNEPEASLLRAKALDHFVREVRAFTLDHGHEMGHVWDERIAGFRLGLEDILGNKPVSVMVRPSQGHMVQRGRGDQEKDVAADATNAKMGLSMV
ncbi:hypothetical protein BC834DRAFT_643802 [Gloeopeniophorella convolvens]|nr:hypothetical protein BC834DRAFT_643802 [Gloeopeniophorella convolvens]